MEIWKQDYKIDLWVWVSVNGKEYDLLIEDKYYSRLHNNQLARYKEQFDKWKNCNRPNSIPLYWLLTCHDKGSTNIYDSAEQEGFTIAYWDDLIEAMGLDKEGVVESESDIFNEFWIRWE